MSQDNTENIERENIENDNIQEGDVSENQTVELTVEEQLQEDLAKEKDKFLRLFAEFENYKKRTAKERIDLFKTANQEVLQAMLPVIKPLESIQSQNNDGLAQALERALNESNKRLSNQLEIILARQVKHPIEEMGQKLENRLSHIRSNPQDLAMKVIRARQNDSHAEASSSAEPL